MRYLGSKGLIPIILAQLEGKTAYWEPFVGGFSVARLIGEQAPQGKELYASDFHTDLILLYQKIKSAGTSWIPDAVSEDEYKHIKGQPSSALRGFMGFGVAFGGKWLGTYARGEGRNYAAESKRSLAKIEGALARFSLWQDDFTNSPETFSELALRGQMVIYCDPPYANTSGYSVDFDQKAFIDTCLRLASWGNVVLVSEYQLDHPLFQEVWNMPSQKRLQTKDRATVERLYKVNAQ
jgi:DNA adenine methylase